MPNALEIALDYIGRGWNPVPVPFRQKRPIIDAWQDLTINVDNASTYFNGNAQNIGVALGAASRGLTDVDLDCPEAIAVAPYLLPRTGAIFGRPSARASHWLYVTDLASQIEQATLLFNDPTTKERLLELRIGGGVARVRRLYSPAARTNAVRRSRGRRAATPRPLLAMI